MMRFKTVNSANRPISQAIVNGCRFRAPKYQNGASLLSTLILVIIAGFIVLCTLKIVPVYLENWQLKSILASIEEEYSESQTVASKQDLKIKLARRMRMDQVTAIDYKKVIIKRENEFLMINANYESRVPLVANIDVVIKFEDNHAKVPYKRGS